MTKKEFLKLIKNAKEDENGYLYFVGDGDNWRTYFTTVTTVCNDFVNEYCYQTENDCEYYNRHFTENDDTIELHVVRNK